VKERYIDINDIKIVRNIRTEIGDVSSLMTSIRENGLLEPIGVARMKNEYILVYGHRRYLALKKLGRKSLEVGKEIILTKDITDEDILISNIVENFHRENNTPLEFAKAASDLKELGLTTSEISVRLCVSKHKIMTALKLLINVPEKQRKHISYGGAGVNNKKGKLPANVASTIADQSSRFKLKGEDVDALYDLAREQELSTSDVRLINIALSEGIPFEKAIELYKEYENKSIELVVKKDELKKIKGPFKQYILSILKGKNKINKELFYK
jgi:ParB/RepB/Spo0J family partition protein